MLIKDGFYNINFKNSKTILYGLNNKKLLTFNT